jgi:hypothetical protein
LAFNPALRAIRSAGWQLSAHTLGDVPIEATQGTVMKAQAGRIAIATIASELLAVLTLVVIVAVLGPSDATAAQAYAERLGFWVGPIAGFGFCLLGGWWVGRNLSAFHVRNGLFLGISVAVLDITILILSGADFHPIFAVSNIGRVLAGLIGGWLASRSAIESARLSQ